MIKIPYIKKENGRNVFADFTVFFWDCFNDLCIYVAVKGYERKLRDGKFLF
jgi:hypothetical protein